LLEAVEQMKAGKKGRTYTKEQLLAISARKSVNLTQREFAKLLDVSIDTVQDWEQGRRSPRGAAKTLLKIAQTHPEVLEQLAS
jgi:putative transcriptional regulator